MEKFKITTCAEALNITDGNDTPLLVKLTRRGEPFPAELSENVEAWVVSARGVRTPVSPTVGDEGRVLIDLPAGAFKPRNYYGLEFTGLLNNAKWRAYGKSMIYISPSTEPGPTSVEQPADGYEVTLEVGYVADVVPRNVSELNNDAGYAKRTEVEQTLEKYAPLSNPFFIGMPKANDYYDFDPKIGGYLPMGTSSPLATYNYVKKLLEGYIGNNQKNAANGVASLDAAGKILAAALNMPWRGNFTGNFQASNVEPGIYGVDDRKIGPNPLNGENAHGVMLVFPDRYKTTLFLVGRPNGSQYGTAPEIYARRWLETANSWTSWFRTDNYAKRDEIPTVPEYTLAKSGSNIQLKKNGEVVGQVTDNNTTYDSMSQAEAEAGAVATARTMTAQILKAAILKHAPAPDLSPYAKKTDIKILIVDFNNNATTCSHTYEEIFGALKNGYTVFGRRKVNNNQYFIYTTSECSIGNYYFVCLLGTTSYYWIRISSSNEISSGLITLLNKNMLSNYALKTDLPSLQTVAASQDNIEVAAGSRVNVQVPLDIPEGYAVGSYKGIGLTSATDDADGFKSCAIQSFSTAGGGTKANISIKSFGDAAVKVKLNVEVLCFKS